MNIRYATPQIQRPQSLLPDPRTGQNSRPKHPSSLRALTQAMAHRPTRPSRPPPNSHWRPTPQPACITACGRSRPEISESYPDMAGVLFTFAAGTPNIFHDLGACAVQTRHASGIRGHFSHSNINAWRGGRVQTDATAVPLPPVGDPERAATCLPRTTQACKGMCNPGRRVAMQLNCGATCCELRPCCHENAARCPPTVRVKAY